MHIMTVMEISSKLNIENKRKNLLENYDNIINVMKK